MDLRKLAFSIDFKGNASPVEDMNKATNKLKDSAKSAATELNKMGKSMTSLGKEMTKKVTTPLIAGIGVSVREFAKLEQSIGGTETMFKDSANEVIKNSETAYKRAGVSANNYMENITSFSASLLQGLGGDTERAAKIADMAMVDMSDNANKFGTDITAIQNAYQGFSKANFTMLDNLKLGYGGTAGEMARLINETGVMGVAFKATAENVKDVPFYKMIEAINKVQDAMGVTGTTALEATETISGAFGMAKASIQDFLGGLGNADADIDQLAKNMFDSFKIVAKNIKGVLTTMWDNIPLENWQKNAIAFSVVVGPALLVVGTLITKILAIGPALMGIKGVVTVFMGPIGMVIAGVTGLIAVITHLWRTNEEFRDKMEAVWENVKTTVGTAVDWISSKWAEHGESIISVTSEVFGIVASLVGTVVTTLIDVIGGLLTFFSGVGNFLTGIFFGDWSRAWLAIQDIVEGSIKTIEGLWNGLKELFKNPIKGTVDLVGKGVSKLFGGNKVDGSHRTGLGRVPFDGYIAETHKDEMILNKGQADEYRRGETRRSENNIVYSPSVNITVGQDVSEDTKKDLESKIKDILAREREKFFAMANIKYNT